MSPIPVSTARHCPSVTDQLRHVLRMWRLQALMAERDPEGHRQMLATAGEAQRIGRSRPGSVSWSELKAELGL